MSNAHLLRRPDVEARTGLARSTISARMSAGTFPRPGRIGRRAVAWPEEAIARWMAHRPAAAIGVNISALGRQLEAEGFVIVDRSGDRPLLYPQPGLGTLLLTGVSP